MRGATFLQKSFSPHPSSKNSYMAGGTTNAAEGPAERGIGTDLRVLPPKRKPDGRSYFCVSVGATGESPSSSPFSKGGYMGIFSLAATGVPRIAVRGRPCRSIQE